MCPMCIAAAALAVVGTASTGGLAAFVVKIFRARNIKKPEANPFA